MDTIIKIYSAFVNALIAEPIATFAAIALLLKTVYDNRKGRDVLKVTVEIDKAPFYAINKNEMPSLEERNFQLHPTAINIGSKPITFEKMYLKCFKGVKKMSKSYKYFTKEKPKKFPSVTLLPSETTKGGALPIMPIGTEPWLKIKDFILVDTTGKPWRLGKRKMKALLKKAKKET